MRGIFPHVLFFVVAITFLGCGGGGTSPPPELANSLPTAKAEKEIVSKIAELPIPSLAEIRFRNDESSLVQLKASEDCQFRAKLKFESPQNYFVLKLIYVRNGGDCGTTIIKPDRLGTTEFQFQLDSMPRPQRQEKGDFQLQVRALNQLLYEEKIVVE